jgi:hypothetical protein
MDKGIDPTDSFDASVRAYENAIRLNSRLFTNSSNLGMVQTRKGMYQLHHGKDPTVALKASIENYRKSLELNPKHIWGYNNAAVALLTLARYEMYQSRNPLTLLEEAIQTLYKAIEIDPNVPYLNIVRSYCLKAEYSVQVRRDPEADLQEARNAIRKYMELSGGALFSNRDEATIELVAAEWALQNGRAARTFLEKAESSLRKALQRNSEDSEAYRQFARYYLVSAKDNIARKINPTTEISLGMEQIAEALKRDERYGESHAIQAGLLSLAATIKQEDAVRKQTIADAKKALIKAFDLNQNLRVKYDPLRMELEKHDVE